MDFRKGVIPLATKTITVRVDEDTKTKAEILLNEIGINTTTLFNACLKALVREQRIPFALVSNEYAQKMPNDLTLRAMYESENGINLHKFDNAEAMFKELAI